MSTLLSRIWPREVARLWAFTGSFPFVCCSVPAPVDGYRQSLNPGKNTGKIISVKFMRDSSIRSFFVFAHKSRFSFFVPVPIDRNSYRTQGKKYGDEHSFVCNLVRTQTLTIRILFNRVTEISLRSANKSKSLKIEAQFSRREYQLTDGPHCISSSSDK